LRFAIRDDLIDSRDALLRVAFRIFQKTVPVSRMASNSQEPTNFFYISASRHGFQKIDRELLRMSRRQAFEDLVFKMRQPRGQTKFVLVSPMIVLVERAADRAAVLTVVSDTLNDLISRVMCPETREVLLLDCRIAVKCFHDSSLMNYYSFRKRDPN